MRVFSDKHEFIQFHGRQTKICVDVFLVRKDGQFIINIPKLGIHTSSETKGKMNEEILRSVNAFILQHKKNDEPSLSELGFDQFSIFTSTGKRTPLEMKPEPDVTRILKVEDSPIENISSKEVKTYTFEHVKKYEKPEIVDEPNT